MRFLLMIFDDQAAWATVGPAEMEQVMQQHDRLTADLKAQVWVAPLCHVWRFLAAARAGAVPRRKEKKGRTNDG